MAAAETRPDLTIVVPFYNRADTVLFTLESVARARGDLKLEVLLVDDGSTPPASEQLRDHPHPPERIVHQKNQGLLFARLTGLREARGEFVLFLDSDDLISPEKLTAQVAAMRVSQAEVSYTDSAQAELRAPYETIVPRPDTPAEETGDAAVFFIRVQPPPHSPIFQTAWLQGLVDQPLFPPSSAYNPVAEIWFYHIAAPFPARVVKVPGRHTIVGHHGGTRLTNQWEKLAVASLGVMEAFMRACPNTPEHRAVRQLVSERAFESWRRLPYDFSPPFQRRMLAVWRSAPRGHLTALGGRQFARLAALLGPVSAARLLRRLRGGSYRSCQSLKDPSTVDTWLAKLPTS